MVRILGSEPHVVGGIEAHLAGDPGEAALESPQALRLVIVVLGLTAFYARLAWSE